MMTQEGITHWKTF